MYQPRNRPIRRVRFAFGLFRIVMCLCTRNADLIDGGMGALEDASIVHFQASQ